MGRIIQYEHHKTLTSVDENLKGRHREHCLCFRCKKFNPEDRGKNCHIANSIYQTCKIFMIVTPVWECTIFQEEENVEALAKKMSI